MKSREEIFAAVKVALSKKRFDHTIMVAENERAGALYRKCGFTECGRQYRGMKFDDGTYHDEILMVKML